MPYKGTTKITQKQKLKIEEMLKSYTPAEIAADLGICLRSVYKVIKELKNGNNNIQKGFVILNDVFRKAIREKNIPVVKFLLANLSDEDRELLSEITKEIEGIKNE